MKRVLITILIVAVVGAGIWYAFGGEKAAQAFGKATGDQVTSIGEILQAPEKFVGTTVTVEGVLTKECPSSGCWWYIADKSGEIRADSLGAAFALPLDQKGRTVRTTGKVIKTEDGELEIAAVGAALK